MTTPRKRKEDWTMRFSMRRQSPVWWLRNNYTFAAMDFGRRLVWCLAIGWCFVAPKTPWGKARRGSIAAALCDRGATKPQAVFGATLRAAVLFASRFVARSSQTAEGYARRSRLAGNENSLRRNTSQLRDTTLATNPRFVTARFYPRAPSTGSRRCGAPQRARLLS